ncbi:MAG: LexA family transcriptional regulator [Saprospiraceae bacterium]
MIYLPTNLKYLRKKLKISQGEIAEELKIARTTYGDYERGKTEPNLELLLNMALKFDVGLDDLISTDLTKEDMEIMRSNELRILAISVDSESNENVELVRTKAEAGYLDSFDDPEYIKDLPKISLPILPEGTFRGFEIRGDSMLPIESGSIILCSYVEQLIEVVNDRTYVIITQESGLVYKRVHKSKSSNKLILFSDNEAYAPYEIGFSDIAEIWQYFAHISFSDLKLSSNNNLDKKITNIERKVNDIYKELNK